MSTSARAAAAYAACFAAVGSSTPYLPVYYSSRGLDLSAIGAVIAVAAAIQLVGAPVWGSIADRSGRSRWVVGAAGFIAAAGAAGLAVAQGIPAIVACASLVAIGLAGVLPVLDARALGTVGADRARYGRLRFWGSASWILTVLVTGALTERSGITTLFLVFVPALVMTALLGSSLPASEARGSHGLVSGSTAVLRVPALGEFLFAALATWAIFVAATSVLSVYLARLGLPGGTIGLVWAVAALAELPVMWAFPALAARFGLERLLVVGALMFPLRAAGYVLTSDPALLVAISALAGVGFGLFLVGGVAYVASKAPPGLAATAQGILSGTSFGLAMVLGSGLGGAVADALSIRGLFAASALLGVTAALGVFAAVSGRRSREPSRAAAAWDRPDQ